MMGSWSWTIKNFHLVLFSSRSSSYKQYHNCKPGFLLYDCIGGADRGEDEEEGTQHKLGVVQTFCLRVSSMMNDDGDNHDDQGDDGIGAFGDEDSTN